MKKALVAALCFIVAGFLMVNGTFADVFNQARDIFADLTNQLGEAFGAPAVDGKFDVALVNIGNVEQLYPGGAATHKVAVKNQGQLNACFRLAFAVQYDAETWNMLHFTFAAGAGFKDEGDWRSITVDGTPYRMKVFTYTGTLAPAAQSDPVSITIAMDKEITSKQISRYRSDFLQTQMLAIEADTFLNAKDANSTPAYGSPVDALNAALPLTDFNPFD